MERLERFFLPAYLPYVTDLNVNGQNDPNRLAVTGTPESVLFWDITPSHERFRY